MTQTPAHKFVDLDGLEQSLDAVYAKIKQMMVISFQTQTGWVADSLDQLNDWADGTSTLWDPNNERIINFFDVYFVEDTELQYYWSNSRQWLLFSPDLSKYYDKEESDERFVLHQLLNDAIWFGQPTVLLPRNVRLVADGPLVNLPTGYVNLVEAALTAIRFGRIVEINPQAGTATVNVEGGVSAGGGSWGHNQMRFFSMNVNANAESPSISTSFLSAVRVGDPVWVRRAWQRSDLAHPIRYDLDTVNSFCVPILMWPDMAKNNPFAPSFVHNKPEPATEEEIDDVLIETKFKES